MSIDRLPTYICATVIPKRNRNKLAERLMKTKKCFATLMLVLSLFYIGSVYGADGFESVRCGGDIPKGLVGRKGSDEPVVKIEERHKDIGLKHLGAEIISDDERLN